MTYEHQTYEHPTYENPTYENPTGVRLAETTRDIPTMKG